VVNPTETQEHSVPVAAPRLVLKATPSVALTCSYAKIESNSLISLRKIFFKILYVLQADYFLGDQKQKYRRRYFILRLLKYTVDQFNGGGSLWRTRPDFRSPAALLWAAGARHHLPVLGGAGSSTKERKPGQVGPPGQVVRDRKKGRFQDGAGPFSMTGPEQNR